MKTQIDEMPVPEGHCFVTITAKKGEGLSIAGQVIGRVETTWPLHEGSGGVIDCKGPRPLLVKAYLEVVMFESSGTAVE